MAVGAAATEAAPKKAAAAAKPWRQPSASGLAVIDANIAANAAGLDGVTVASKPPAGPAPAAPLQEQVQEQQAPHAVGMPRRVHADPRQTAAAMRSGPPLLATLANRDAATKAAATVPELPAAVAVPMEEVMPTSAPAGATPVSPVVQELEPLVQVLITAPLPERKAALEALAELLRTHGLQYSETLGELLAQQPPSVRLPLGRLLARRVPNEVLAPAIR